MKSVLKNLCPVIAVAGAGFVLYQGLIAKSISTQQMVMGIGMVLLLALSIYNASQQSGGKKVSFREAYAEFIGDSFLDNKKMEQKLFVALENLGRNKNSAAVKRLNELLPLCRSDEERFTCHVFKGMAYSRDSEPSKAAESYHAALELKETTTAWSNLGLCLSKTGNDADAEDAYLNAIRLNENNAYALNNLAQLYIHKKDFVTALEYANRAFQANDRLLQAINAITICHGALGNEEKFDTFFKLAVKCGTDGPGLKKYVEELRSENR